MRKRKNSKIKGWLQGSPKSLSAHRFLWLHGRFPGSHVLFKSLFLKGFIGAGWSGDGAANGS